MRELNALGKMVVSMEPSTMKLDGNVKKILAYKPLLARIFKEVVAECRELSHEEIERFLYFHLYRNRKEAGKFDRAIYPNKGFPARNKRG